MSADNCIAILKTTDSFKKISENEWVRFDDSKPSVVYRVCHIQGMDQLFDYENEQLHNLGWAIAQWFPDDRTTVFYSEDEAWDYAIKISEKYTFLEYGICIIDMTKYNFPDC